MQKLSEESLAQLKNFYETEKERLEREMNKKTEANQKRISSIQEEYEIRLRDEQNQHEEDLEMIQEELREKEIQLQGLGASFEHEKSMSMQKIESLEANLKETKNTLSRMQEIMNENVEQQKNSFLIEKKELLEKLE